MPIEHVTNSASKKNPNCLFTTKNPMSLLSAIQTRGCDQFQNHINRGAAASNHSNFHHELLQPYHSSYCFTEASEIFFSFF